MFQEKSGQESAKGDNDVVNQIRHILERFDRRFRVNDARCVERYVEGEALILVHWTIEGYPQEFVAHFQAKADFRKP